MHDTDFKAAIDIGTNTAHIIIGRIINGDLEILYRQRHYVYLAEKGISVISQEAENRLFKALSDFKVSLDNYHNCQVFVTATEAMRRAENGKDIVKKIQKDFGWTPHVITGESEAQYIFKGVSHAVNLSSGSFLTVDIGGGSVEFIHSMDGEIKSIRSLPVGIANLYHQFHHSDPLSEENETKMLNFLNKELDFLNPLRSQNTQLIGSAGTFEILYSQSSEVSNVQSEIVKVKHMMTYYDSLRWQNEEERKNNALIPGERAKYIVMALILVKFLTDQLGINEFWVSQFALKEGVLLSH